VVGFIASPLVKTVYSVMGPLVWGVVVCQSGKIHVYIGVTAHRGLLVLLSCARGVSPAATNKAIAIVLPVIDSPLRDS